MVTIDAEPMRTGTGRRRQPYFNPVNPVAEAEQILATLSDLPRLAKAGLTNAENYRPLVVPELYLEALGERPSQSASRQIG